MKMIKLPCGCRPTVDAKGREMISDAQMCTPCYTLWYERHQASALERSEARRELNQFSPASITSAQEGPS